MAVGFVSKKEKETFQLPKFLSFLKNKDSDFYFYCFMLLMGVCFFAFALFNQYFTTPLGGDYNSQQFSFYTNGYDDWWRFFTTGQFTLYDTNTFLGASNIGSNSFYYLFDPFFMPVLLFPRVFIPQAMAIMTIFKMALAGLLFSRYLRYIGISAKTSRIAGLAYAFSGWVAWYLWFNHFTGIAVLFPVVLWGVEKTLREKKPWLLMLSLGLLGFCNFFFFFTFTICAFMYAMFRFFQKVNTRTVKENFTLLGIGFVGFFAGCLIGMAVIVPATVVSLNAPRATNSTYLTTLKEALANHDFGTFFYHVFSWEADGTEFKVFYPFVSFIFPTMTNRGTALATYITSSGSERYDNVAGSIFCYFPFIILLFPTLVKSAKEKRFSHFIAFGIFILMLFTPFCYYAFHGFTVAYARWNLFIVTSLITYVSFYIDKMKKEPKWPIITGGVISVFLVWVAVQIAYVLVHEYPTFKYRDFNLNMGGDTFVIIEGFLATAYVILITCIILFRYKKKRFDQVLIGAISFELIIMGLLTLNGHGVSTFMNVNNGYYQNNEFQNVINKIKKDDPTYYRCYSSQENSGARNDGMRHNYNGLGVFHSVYNFNDYGFLNWSQINDGSAPGSYSASYVEKRQNLDTFLGVKYYFVRNDKYWYGDSKAAAMKYEYYRGNVPIGFVDVTDQYPNKYFRVFKNMNYVDLGFAFDNITTIQMYDSSKGENDTYPSSLLQYTFYSEELYLNSAIVPNTETERFDGIIPEEKRHTSTEARAFTQIKSVNSAAYTRTFYDIHKGSEGGQNCSASSFVSKLVDLSEYPSSTTFPTKWDHDGRFVEVYDAKSNFPYDPNGMVFYINNTYLSEQRVNVYFTTKVMNENNEEEEKFILFDNHNDDGFSLSSTSRKNWRGFYVSSSIDKNGNFVPAPKVSKIIICARKTQMYNRAIFYESGTTVLDRLAALKEGGLQDVHYRENHFDFKTNHSERKVVVTQLPYEEGFTLTAKDKDGNKKKLEIFKAQGGFVSFISEEGETSYSLDFYTPYLREGSYLSMFGVLIASTTYLGYLVLRMIKDDRELKERFGNFRDEMYFYKDMKYAVKHMKKSAKSVFSQNN